MPRIARTFRLEEQLLGRLAVVAAARGCTQTDLVEAGLLLVLADPPASREAVAVRADAAESERQERRVVPAGPARSGHLPSCRCPVCRPPR